MKRVPATASHEKYLNEELRDPAMAKAYINAAIQENDPRIVMAAIRNVARAHGIQCVADEIHTHRENLSRMLSRDGNPRLTNLLRIFDALGFIIQVKNKAAA